MTLVLLHDQYGGRERWNRWADMARGKFESPQVFTESSESGEESDCYRMGYG